VRLGHDVSEAHKQHFQLAAAEVHAAAFPGRVEDPSHQTDTPGFVLENPGERGDLPGAQERIP
jgi:hypothetical protein